MECGKSRICINFMWESLMIINNCIEQFEKSVGFRKIEIIDNIMYLNGQRIVFKGVNRHGSSVHLGKNSF